LLTREERLTVTFEEDKIEETKISGESIERRRK
jgi:hypothetical protein